MSTRRPRLRLQQAGNSSLDLRGGARAEVCRRATPGTLAFGVQRDCTGYNYAHGWTSLLARNLVPTKSSPGLDLGSAAVDEEFDAVDET